MSRNEMDAREGYNTRERYNRQNWNGTVLLDSVVDIDLHVGETLSFFQSVGTVEVVSERFMT